MPELPRVILYTRKDCHLCDDAKAIIETVKQEIPFSLDVLDVDTKSEWQTTYGLEVPVVFVNEKKFSKYHVEPERLRQWLRA